MDKDSNNTLAAIQAGMLIGEPHDLGHGLQAILRPANAAVDIIDTRDKTEKYAAGPRRKTGNFTLGTALSFAAYVNAHKTAATAVYADKDDTLFTAVFNDHAAEGAIAGPPVSVELHSMDVSGEGGAEDLTSAIPNEVTEALLGLAKRAMAPRLAGWRDFQAIYSCPLSVEWVRWMEKSQHGSNKQGMKHTDFVQFLEDNLLDITKPTAAELLQAVRSFEAKKDVKFGSAVRLENGDMSFNYTDETVQVGGEGKLVMPDQFTITIPVFDGGAKYEVDARVRYRIANSGLSLWYELVRPHKVLEHAFNATRAVIEGAINPATADAAAQPAKLIVPIYDI